MKLALIAENFNTSWSPFDLRTFIAGCQECIILFTKTINKYIPTTVYMRGKNYFQEIKYINVYFKDFSHFSFDNYTTIILFNINPFLSIPENKNVIYWSSSIEKNEIQGIKNIVFLTYFHRLKSIPFLNSLIIPHGIDKHSLQNNRHENRENAILYSSSLDRGFETLLADWPKIKSRGYKLYVTYGFKMSKLISESKEEIEKYEEDFKQLCIQNDIIYLGSLNKNDFEKLYWTCKFWIHPLNNEESELFCLNAIKAQYCGCIPIINKIGSLRETVGDYIDYVDFVNGVEDLSIVNYRIPMFTWDEVVEREWIKLLK